MSAVQAAPPADPPHDLEAEASVLGAILLDREAIAKAAELLRPSDFYRPGNGQLYEAALNLFREGEPIDNTTLAAELIRLGALERIGGRAHLALLQEQVPTAANVERYARIVAAMARKRALIEAGRRSVELGMDPARDADDAVNQAQAHHFALSGELRSGGLVRLADEMPATMSRIDAQMESGAPQAGAGVSTGLADLDRLTGGFRPGDLVIVAARPSMGKTSLATGVALHAAMAEQVPTAIWSLEMSRASLVDRILCEQAQVDSQRLLRGMVNDAEHERLMSIIGPLGEAPVWIDDSSSLDDTTLRIRARQARSRYGIGLIFVDYLQRLHAKVGRGDPNRVQEVSAIARALKSIARELSVPVVALSQLSRSPEARPNKRPILSDLRESGELEQEADLVIGLYRDEYYNRDTDKPGIAEAIVLKHRNGPTGVVELAFLKQYTRFESLERRHRMGDE